MYARGAYQHKVLPNIQGQAVVMIDYGAQPAAGGRNQINTAISGSSSSTAGSCPSSAGSRPRSPRKGEKEARKLAELFAETTHAIEADPAAVFEKVASDPTYR